MATPPATKKIKRERQYYMKRKILSIFILIACLCASLLFTACNPTPPPADEPAQHREATGVVSKKGVCISRYGGDNQDNGDKINDLNGSWWYNWGAKPTNTHIDGQFVPMIWGKGQVTSENLTYVKAGYEQGKFTHLLTFNEPDLPDQSNMTVDEALSYWEQLENIGIPLSSPAVSYYSAERGNEWLDEFMQKAKERGYRVDFIAIHLYQSFYSSGVVDELKKTMDALYKKYNIPVWLTEFGAIDIIARDSHQTQPSASCTQTNANAYIKNATDMLERLGYVERYAWFVDNFAGLYGNARPWEAPYTTLYNDDDTISQSGVAYKEIVSNIPLIFETPELPTASAGVAFTQSLLVAGGTGDYTFTATGLPRGFTLSKGGVLTGTASEVGIFPISVTVTDQGQGARKQSFTRKVVLKVKKAA